MADIRFGVTKRALLRALLLVMTIIAFALVGLLPGHAQCASSAGCRTISFGAGNDVGASADDVRSVALGDLDIVSGNTSHEGPEIIAWLNDSSANRSSPFQGAGVRGDKDGGGKEW